ncbi:hypothetical protein ES703_94661 [subsurface metagenome]
MVTQIEEKELFNKVLEEAARLVIEHKKAGLPFEIRPGELETIYRKYADITDESLFKRFFKYMKSPEGRQYFKKTIRTKLWRAGFSPKGWEESHSSEEGSNPKPQYPKVEELGHEIYGVVYTKADAVWDFVSGAKFPKQPPFWEEVRDTFIENLTQEIKAIPNLDLAGERAKMKTIGMMLERYPEAFPKEVLERWKGE